jgi:hypothetical protein
MTLTFVAGFGERGGAHDRQVLLHLGRLPARAPVARYE